MTDESFDLEHFENYRIDNQLIQQLGFIDSAHFERYKNNAIHGLRQFGDAFSRGLGEALKLAERDDALKIVRYWNQRCDQAVLMYKMHQEKQKHEVQFLI